MMPKESKLDLIFGVGFKVGFLIVVVGMMTVYMPILAVTVDSILDISDAWGSFLMLPSWLQAVITGFTLMGVAVVLYTGRYLVEDMVHHLFGRDVEGF
ncbi:MAG: hypothetical protein V1744_03900 [Candidatus Altiarchaeota archaeon]